MTTLYKWDENNIFIGTEDVDELGPVPKNSTTTKPPSLSGVEVAQWVGSGWVKLDNAPTASLVDIEYIRSTLVKHNNAAYSDAIGQLTSDYPFAEIATWERQRAEVVAWVADSTTSTPWIDIAASARGVDRDVYLARTLAKVNAFAQASAYLTGTRQRFDDIIKAATTHEELTLAVIDYTIPT